MNIAKIILVTICAMMFCADIHAQTEKDAKRDDIKKLFEVMNIVQVKKKQCEAIVPILRSSRPDLPEEFFVRYLSSEFMDRMIEASIPIYDKHFTHEEIQEMIKFYESPLGKKWLRVQPQLNQECEIEPVPF